MISQENHKTKEIYNLCATQLVPGWGFLWLFKVTAVKNMLTGTYFRIWILGWKVILRKSDPSIIININYSSIVIIKFAVLKCKHT